jgi:hypothetical protein
MRMNSILAAALVGAGLATAAHAGETSVKDWDAVCDNVGTCTAFGLTSEDSDGDSYIRITRPAGDDAGLSVLLVYDAPDTQGAQTVALALDGKPIAGFGAVKLSGSDIGARATLTGAPALALVEALRDGQQLSFNAGGKDLADVSLAGSAAILLWVDAQQGRVGTVTALIKQGPKPAAAVPGPRPAPLIPVAAPVEQAGLPKHAPRGLAEKDPNCDVEPDKDEASMDLVARLTPRTVLYGPICDLAAYNELMIFFVGDEKGGHLRKLTFPEPPGTAADDFLMNIDFDAKTQTLKAFAKGRGVGDCGSEASWVWDGHAFQLLRETAMTECRRVLSQDWATTYVARRK